MNNSFCQLNLLKSSSIEDVKYFSLTSTITSDIKPDETLTYKYSVYNEIKHAADWKHDDFEYTINYLGFRMPAIPKEVDIGVFGCSFTFGIGMPISGLWHTLIGKELNATIANFGIAGLSAVSVLDIFLIVSKHIKIKKAIFLLPSFNRYQLALTNPTNKLVQYLSIIPNHKSKLHEDIFQLDDSSIYKVLPEEQFYKDVRNTTYLAEYIAEQRGIEIYFTSWESESYQVLKNMRFNFAKLLPEWYHPEEIGKDLARDLHHPGFKLNNFFANSILPFIK